MPPEAGCTECRASIKWFCIRMARESLLNRQPGICAIREKRAIMCAVLGGEAGMRLGFK